VKQRIEELEKEVKRLQRKLTEQVVLCENENCVRRSISGQCELVRICVDENGYCLDICPF